MAVGFSSTSSSDGRGVSPPSSRAASWSAVVPSWMAVGPMRPRRSHACTPLSHAAVARGWSPLPSPNESACRWARPLSTSSRSCTGASGLRVGDSANPAPVAAGTNCSWITPLGM